jgi:hypothetical protein
MRKQKLVVKQSGPACSGTAFVLWQAIVRNHPD